MATRRYEAMELPRLAVLVVVVAAAPVAHAQQAAAPDSAERAASRHTHSHHGNGALGMRVGGGAAYANGVPDAWLVRLDYELFLHLPPRGTVGAVLGYVVGLDYWRGAPDNWGFGLPFNFVLGVRAPFVRGYVGWGFDYLLVDQVNGDTGVGFAAPMALVNLGVDINGWTVIADTRVTRRWQLGAPDHTQWMFSVMVGGTLEGKRERGAI